MTEGRGSKAVWAMPIYRTNTFPRGASQIPIPDDLSKIPNFTIGVNLLTLFLLKYSGTITWQ